MHVHITTTHSPLGPCVAHLGVVSDVSFLAHSPQARLKATGRPVPQGAPQRP